MNAPHPVASRDAIKLTAQSFLLLRGAGAFDAYWKAELLDGELWGVASDGSDQEPESDEELPIKLTIEQYELLDGAGAFAAHQKTELVEGTIYSMSPQYRAHGFAKDELAYRLRRALEGIGSRLHVATEQSMAIAPFSEPQPDIVLTSQPIGPGAIPVASVALIVEVSDSTAAFDRGDKALLYAAAGVPEYWVADVNGRTIHQMWAPVGTGYTRQREIAFGERIDAATVDGLTIDTATLLTGDDQRPRQ